MEVGVIVVVIVALLVVGWLFQKFWEGANKQLFRRGSHKKAQILKDSPLHFRTTGDARQVREWILGHLKIEPNRPSAMAGLYISGQDEETTRISYGKLVGGDHLTFDLDIVQEGAQSVGTVELLAWKESDGVMTTPQVLGRVYTDVCAAVRQADPYAVIENPLAV